MQKKQKKKNFQISSSGAPLVGCVNQDKRAAGETVLGLDELPILLKSYDFLRGGLKSK